MKILRNDLFGALISADWCKHTEKIFQEAEDHDNFEKLIDFILNTAEYCTGAEAYSSVMEKLNKLKTEYTKLCETDDCMKSDNFYRYMLRIIDSAQKKLVFKATKKEL